MSRQATPPLQLSFSIVRLAQWVRSSLAEMSKRGKKRDEDEALSEIEEPPKKNPKTFADGDASDEPDQIHICDLSKNRKVSVRNWQGKIVVDIREFYVKDGKEFPGKKGISLNIDQWNILRDHVDEIDIEVAGKA